MSQNVLYDSSHLHAAAEQRARTRYEGERNTQQLLSLAIETREVGTGTLAELDRQNGPSSPDALSLFFSSAHHRRSHRAATKPSRSDAGPFECCRKRPSFYWCFSVLFCHLITSQSFSLICQAHSGVWCLTGSAPTTAKHIRSNDARKKRSFEKKKRNRKLT